MTKRELEALLAPLDDEALVHVLCVNERNDVETYAEDVGYTDVVAGEDLMNEITLVARYWPLQRDD